MIRNVVIVSACRTAIGKFQGQFKSVSARDLAVTVGKEAIQRAKVDAACIDEIVMGECYPHMQGSLPARQVSMRIGLDERSNAVSVNQNCASGMRALEIACNDILLGKTEVALVIGTENMTQAPYMLPKARMGYRMGDIATGGGGELYDSLIHDALYDELVPGHMGVTADRALVWRLIFWRGAYRIFRCKYFRYKMTPPNPTSLTSLSRLGRVIQKDLLKWS